MAEATIRHLLRDDDDQELALGQLPLVNQNRKNPRLGSSRWVASVYRDASLEENVEEISRLCTIGC